MMTEKRLSKTPKVAIIGGGAGGLYAAHTIKKQQPKWDVDVFEAAPYVGGRIRTYYSQDSSLYAEEGAFLIANTDEKVINLAHELEVKLEARIDPIYHRYFTKGKLADMAEFNAIFKKYIVDEIIALGITKEEDWLNHLELDKLSLEQFLRLKTSKLESDYIIQSISCNFSGLHSDDVKNYSALDALRFFNPFLKTTGFFSVEGGNQQLMISLAHNLEQNGVIINREHPVTCLTQKNGQAIVTFNNKTGEHQAVFDRVIVAIPPMMLNSHTPKAIKFTPPLPQQTLFDALPVNTTITRVYFETDIRPWLKETPTAAVIIGDADGALWIEDHTSHIDKKGAIIEVHASGNIGLMIQHADDPIEMATDMLTNVYPSLRDHLLSAKMVIWNDPYQKGAYAFCAPGQVTTLRQLSQSHELIDFAGPYLSIEYPGSVEGAMRSGGNAANRVISKINEKVPTIPNAD